jgi:murein DD-endopeptidase MepM/ murein hydrolase activator NlpD
MVTSLFAALPAQAAVGDGEVFSAGMTSELWLGRPIEPAPNSAEVTNQFVIVPGITLIGSAPESPFLAEPFARLVPDFSRLAPDPNFSASLPTPIPTASQSKSTSETVTVVQVPTTNISTETFGQPRSFAGLSILDGSSMLSTRSINFLTANGLGNTLLASADLLGMPAVTSATPITPIAVATPVSVAPPVPVTPLVPVAPPIPVAPPVPAAPPVTLPVAVESPVAAVPPTPVDPTIAVALPAAPTSFAPAAPAPAPSTLPFRNQQLAQAIDLQILAPIARRTIIPRLPNLDLPPLPGADRLLPGDSTTPALTQGFTWPAQGVFTSGYGYRWGRMHRGIDIAGPVGTPIVAAAEGVVVTAGWNSGGFGNLVEVRHADGSKTLYAHSNRILVRVGQQVAQGEQIAEMGSTGRSTGPHLHFEIHPTGRGATNPMVFLSRS